MSTYKVVVLGVQGRNNKVYGPGQLVTEAHFPEGNAKILEKEGKLELLKNADLKKLKAAEKAAAEQAAKEKDEKEAAEKAAAEQAAKDKK